MVVVVDTLGLVRMDQVVVVVGVVLVCGTLAL